MKQILYLFLISLFCFNITVLAQNPEWINYTDKSLINAIEIEGEFLWIGTDGGLVKYNKVTGTKIFYQKINSGLPFNRVSCIAIDEAGNKWIGTGQWDEGGGMVKFDGSEWAVYNTSNSDVPSNTINCITIDESGNKWIGTQHGMAKFDGLNWQIFNHYASYNINCITIDEFDNKWIGFVGGLLKFDGEDWIRYDTVGITMQSGVSSIAIDIDGSIWVGDRSGGLAKFDGVICTKYWNPSFTWDGVVSLAIDEEGNKWIGTDYNGLGKFNNVSWEWYEPFDSPVRYSGVSSIKIDASGNKWIGCRYVQGWSGDYVGAGLVKYDDIEFTFIDNFSEELLSNDVRCITIDGENNKWIGTFGGLSKYDGSEWSMYNSENSDLPGNFIKCLATNSNGDLWVGSGDWNDGGLTEFNGTDWTVYNKTNSGLPSNVASCIAIDEFGSKWVGTRNGLVMFDYPYWSLYNPSNRLPDNDILSIAIEEFDNLWVGTANGLVELYVGNIYNTSNSGLPGDRITCIAIDDSGSKWIGTWEGLAKFDGSDWQVYNTSNSDIPSNTINCITIDESDNKWIGTWEGLAKFDGTNWQVYNTSNSVLPNNSVTCVATDIYNNIWIGTGGYNGYGGGLVVFNESGIVSVEDNTTDQVILPNEYLLSQNYPNPFNPSTTIKYQIPANGKREMSNTKLIVYDILGREVATLVNEQQKAGYYEVQFTSNNVSARGGQTLTSGVYFYRIQAGEFVETKKMILLR